MSSRPQCMTQTPIGFQSLSEKFISIQILFNVAIDSLLFMGAFLLFFFFWSKKAIIPPSLTAMEEPFMVVESI